MNTLKLEFTIDTTSAKHLDALANFLQELRGEKEEPKKRATKANLSKVEDIEDIEVIDAEILPIAPAEELPTAQPAEEVKPEPVAKKAEPIAGITEIRSVLASKVGNHREAIKAELERLDAKNVTSLKEENYNGFFEFLEKL